MLLLELPMTYQLTPDHFVSSLRQQASKTSCALMLILSALANLLCASFTTALGWAFAGACNIITTACSRWAQGVVDSQQELVNGCINTQLVFHLAAEEPY